MSFSFTDEHVEFRSVLRRFLTEKSPTAEVRRLMETDDGYDPEAVSYTHLTLPTNREV